MPADAARASIVLPSMDRWLVRLFALTIFGSAALLFAVQPMIARMVLSRLGGSPGVWTTSVLFFQLLLLLGYVYAHVAMRRLTPRRQVVLHVGLLAAGLLVLPIRLPEGTLPPRGRRSGGC